MRQGGRRDLRCEIRPGPVVFAGKAVLAVCLLLAWGGMSAHAESMSDFMTHFRQAAVHGKTTHLIDIDNDSLLLTRADGLYSSGLRYTQQHEVQKGSQALHYAWRLGQELYTASDIKLRPQQIASNDHPYAGWLYAGLFKQTVQQNGAAWKWGVDLGCLGPCAGGEWTQTTLHRILNQPLPEGWDTQVNNELGVVLYAKHAFVPWRWHSRASLTPVVQGRFGNIFTDAAAALVLRVGTLEKVQDRSSWHGYFRVEGRAVGYNATLQGGYFSDDNFHTVSPERLVGAAEAGVVWRSRPYAIRISVIRRGNEVQGLSNAQGSQNIGSLRLSYSP